MNAVIFNFIEAMKRIKRIHHRSKGFSLVEVMMAVFVLSIGIVAVTSMQVTSLRQGDNARRSTLDAVNAGICLEQILAMPYNHALLSDTDSAFRPSNPDHGPYSIEDYGGTIEWEICDNFPSSNIKRITVTIRRSTQKGFMHTVSYEYLKAKGYRQ